MRIGGKLISGAEKIALLEEHVTTSGFICICDDEVARGSCEIFEFGDSFGCVIGPTIERGDTGAFAENVGAIDIPISFVHPGGFLGECRKGFAAVGGAALPEKNERLRVFGIELVERIVCEQDGAVIFFSCVAEI